MAIAVLGTGKMGSGLTRLWARAGETVIVGSRDAAKAQGLAAEIAKEYPALMYGATVEVRPVAPECAVALSLLDKDEEEGVLQTGASQFN